ncbi:MAG: hypothetical protein DHS20C21_17330 [Gemmatimonadota bacterium]|nr:MAG: hypothetical protein DHS20C21_17330 [Gemmatimonadota bacterium]
MFAAVGLVPNVQEDTVFRRPAQPPADCHPKAIVRTVDLSPPSGPFAFGSRLAGPDPISPPEP